MRHAGAATLLAIFLISPSFAACPDWHIASPPPFTLAGTSGTRADFDGDGNLDVITWGIGIRIAFGDGRGGFTRSVTLLGQSLIADLAVGDLNGDTRPDIVVPFGNQGSGPAILANRGGDAFDDPQALADTGGVSRFAIGDFNGDTRPDLFVVGTTPRQTFTLLGDGHGNFATVPAGIETAAAAIIAGDFTGDGKGDLALADALALRIAAGDGAGHFRPPVELPITATVLAAADMNRDGRMDLVAGAGSGLTIILATAVGFESHPVPDVPTVRSIALGDFNLDGMEDVAALLPNASTVSLLLGDGTGALRRSDGYDLVTARSWITAADFNRDGVDDVVASGIVTLLAGSSGTFLRETRMATIASPGYVIAADFDGDGSIDLAVDKAFGPGVLIHWNRGGGLMAESSPALDSIAPARISSADIDGDGRPELIAALPSGFVIFRYDQGAWSILGTYLTANVGVGGTVGGDFDGDGRADIAVTSPEGIDIVSLAGGTAQRIATLPLGPRLQPVLTGDFDHDGRLDFVVMRQGTPSSLPHQPPPAEDGFVAVLLNRGALTFEERRVLISLAPFQVVSGDFDRDGLPDLAVTSWAPNDATKGQIAYNNENARGFIIQNLALPLQPGQALATGDLDGDGYDDLVALGLTYSAAYLFHGRSVPAREVRFATPAGGGVAAVVADIDHTGELDIVATSYYTSDLLLMHGRCESVRRRTMRR